MLLNVIVLPTDSSLLPILLCICNCDYLVDQLLELKFVQDSLSRIHLLSKFSTMNIYSNEGKYKAFITRIE